MPAFRTSVSTPAGVTPGGDVSRKRAARLNGTAQHGNDPIIELIVQRKFAGQKEYQRQLGLYSRKSILELLCRTGHL